MDSGITPEKEWWTAAELAEAKLPGLPGSVRGVNAFAERWGWKNNPAALQRRPGRGGGLLFHWSVLPSAAREKLAIQEAAAPVERPDRTTAWVTYEKLSQKAKDEAAMRLDAIRKVELLHGSGTAHVQAVATIAAEFNASPRTIYNWLALIEGIPAVDQLAYLAPQPPKKRTRKEDRAKFKPFMDWLKSVFLQFEGPTFSQCYRKAKLKAEKEGWPFPIQKTAKRWVDAEVQRTTQIYTREGPRGLMRCYPAQIRDRSSLTAMEAVNADCHKIDVFVEWPDGTVNRPQIIAFQDLYSNKILSWRVDHDPNKVMVMAAFGEMIDTWCIPKRCLFDNGHEFANKWMTAGAPTRFRFKIRETDPVGVLPLLGIQMHWATPAHGQAKPIERAFRDIASDIAKDPRFAGAYVGNRPTAKPENYGSRAVKLAEFLEVLAEGIEEHNSRPGRRSANANGRSFDDTFADSYATTTLLKATEEQRNLWLMGQDTAKLHKHNGSLNFHGNVYHCDWMSQEANRNIVVRFDPEDLHSGVHIYSAEGAHLGFAECQQKIGFFDLEGARSTAKRKRQIAKAEKKLADLHRPHTPEQLGADLNEIREETTALMEAKVVKLAPAKPPRVSTFRQHSDPSAEAAQDALILQIGDKRKKPEPSPKQEAFKVAATADDRFAQAQEIERRQQNGDPVGEREAGWLKGYQTHSEYEALAALKQAFGGNNAG
ncbi:Mu transposase C-terminal domain-containing protein [Leisingera sp. M527]|uniref:transposase domain-containing protein n=1 Tax=Leisingera sp. M527 TaxID=2867014 RepID=UPI0021A75E2C|nr:transposase domain-containing protein [Leisingera sp. M527]UWQ31265.1 Mu transposase C-terminal domain-containing protein [Leisingera sp. M527]